MIKRVLTILLLSVLILQFVSAIDTNIKIKTVSNSEVQLTVMDASTSAFSSLAHYINNSGTYGDLEFTYSGDESNLDLLIIIKKFDEKIYYKKYRENYVAGEDIYLEIEPEGYALTESPVFEELNLTVDLNETNSTEEANLTEEINETNLTINQTGLLGNNSFGIKGMAISDLSKSSFKFLYYILGFIALLTLGYFGLKFKRKQPHKIKVVKLSELKAQEQAISLKKEKRIKELQDNIARDREELEGFSRGQSQDSN